MNYSFLSLQILLLQCIQEAQYISLQMGNGESSLIVLKEYGRTSIFDQDSMRKIPRTFSFIQISWCTRVLDKMLCVHVDIALKFIVYTHKQLFFGDFLGTSKHNLSKGGPRSLHRDMKFHNDVIYQVW